ncbi:MAG: hypothetical protein HC824_02340 [Synechococcales cyanobacterium RM1_1_8]|nr:hypothetical protein [Synechococcales cyanobacterium RM1_1_8]
MGDRDNFAGGFLVGAILGGILGGVLGATLSQRQSARLAADPGDDRLPKDRLPKDRLPKDRLPKGNGQRPEQPLADGEGARLNGDRPRRWIRRTPEAGSPPVASEARIEEARRNLEQKIAQLNSAIDDARQKLGEASAPQVSSAPQAYGQEQPEMPEAASPQAVSPSPDLPGAAS